MWRPVTVNVFVIMNAFSAMPHSTWLEVYLYLTRGDEGYWLIDSYRYVHLLVVEIYVL